MRHVIRVSALFFLCASLAGAQEALKPAHIDVDGIFALAKKRAAQPQTVSFTFTQKTSVMGQTIVGTGEGWLKSPDRSRIVIRMTTPRGEMKTSVISDGKTMWQVVEMPMGLQVVKYDLTTLDTGTAARMNGLGPWGVVDPNRVEALKNQALLQFDMKVMGKDEVSGTPVYVVDLRPKSEVHGGPVSMDRRRVEVGAEDGFLRTMEIFDKAGNPVMRLALQTLSFDASAADSMFTYTPPPGVPVGDGNAMMKRMKDMQTGQMGLLKKEAPDFTLKSLDGKEVSLKSLRGKTVLIDFWASWCGPCKEALPHIQKFHEALKGRGVVVLGIDAEPAGVAEAFVKEKGYTFTTLADSERRVSELYKVQAIPTTVVVDKNGIVQSYMVGYRPEAEVRAALTQAGAP